MKQSFYGHFVAGEDQPEIKSYLSLMRSYGVGAILDYAVEADIPQTKIDERLVHILLFYSCWYLVYARLHNIIICPNFKKNNLKLS